VKKKQNKNKTKKQCMYIVFYTEISCIKTEMLN
jgi:hypothetical protein